MTWIKKMQKVVKISDLVIPPYQILFSQKGKQYKHIILTSGRAGAKSSGAAILADYKVINPQKASVVVLRKHHNKLRKTVYKEMLRGINRLQIPKKKYKITVSPMEITYLRTGNSMYFAGSDGVDDTKGIIDEDRPISLVILDELTEFFDDGEGEDELTNIEATFIRGNRGSFQMIYIYNPPKNPNAPINEWCRKMEKRPDCIHIHTTYKDVPQEWLGPDLIESARIMEQIDPKMYRWVWLGESIGVDELVYYMFGNGNIFKPDGERMYPIVYVGGDYGQQNATTFQFFGLDTYQRKITGLTEFYHSGRESGQQLSPSQYAAEFLKKTDEIHERFKTRQFFLFLDPSARGLSEEIKREYQRANGPYTIIFRDAENDVKLGISRVSTALLFKLLTISPEQEHTKKEFGLYEYDKKSIERGDEKPIKLNDHCLDAIRYMIMGAWIYLRQWLPPGYEEQK